MDNRYMMRGVSAAKEDVHNAIKNIDKGIFPKRSVRLYQTFLAATLNTATLCMLTELVPNRRLPICTGKRRATSPYGKVLPRMLL